MATATFQDMSILATDATFGSRVFEALMVYCWNVVPNESITSSTASLHQQRKNFVSQILNNPNFYKPLFVNVVAANQTVANDATSGGTLVGMTGSQVSTAALNCTDTDISNAIAASFNSFITGI